MTKEHYDYILATFPNLSVCPLNIFRGVADLAVACHTLRVHQHTLGSGYLLASSVYPYHNMFVEISSYDDACTILQEIKDTEMLFV